MSDNVAISSGSGTTIATDEVTDSVFGTAQVQFMKLIDGRDNGTNRTAVDTGNNLQVAPQATVSDTPQSYLDGTQQPLSLTPDGRVRVSSVVSDLTKLWQTTFENPWDELTTSWGTEKLHYV